MNKGKAILDEHNEKKILSAKKRRETVIGFIKEQPLQKISDEHFIKLYLDAYKVSMQTFEKDVKMLTRLGLIKKTKKVFWEYIQPTEIKTKIEDISFSQEDLPKAQEDTPSKFEYQQQ